MISTNFSNNHLFRINKYNFVDNYLTISTRAISEVRVWGKSELVSGEDEVVELGVEHGHDQQKRDDRDWKTTIGMLN